LNLERKGLARPLEGLFGAMNDGSREFLADLTGCPLVHGQRNLLVLEFGLMQQGESARCDFFHRTRGSRGEHSDRAE